MIRTWAAATCTAMTMALVLGTQVTSDADGGGTQRWDGRSDVGEPSVGRDLALSPDGTSTYVAGRTGGATDAHVVVLARNAATGASRWSATWSDPTRPRETAGAQRVAVSPDGERVFVVIYAGCNDCPAPRSFWITLALDSATGEQLWVDRTAVVGGPYSLVVSADGSTVVANGEGSTSGSGDQTLALDAATGAVRWSDSTYGNHPVIGGAGLALSADGEAVYSVAHRTAADGCPAGSFVTVVSTYDLDTGTRQPTTSTPLCGMATSIAASPDGTTLLVAGTSADYSGSMQTQAIDLATGAVRWTRRHFTERIVQSDQTPGVAVSPDGATAYTTASLAGGLAPVVTYAYDLASGATRWAARYDGGGDAFAVDLDASPDGSRLYVVGAEQMRCGRSCSPEDGAGVLLAYDALTGEQQWVSRYPGGYLVAVESSLDGSQAYVAGKLVPGPVLGRRARAGAGCTSAGCGIATASFNNTAIAYRVDDSDVDVRWSAWAGRFRGTALGGADRASRAVGAAVTYVSPAARSVRWVTRVGPTMGRATVLVDGRSKGTWDLYAASESRKVVTIAGLADKAHRVRVVVTGRRNAASRDAWVVADAFATSLVGDIKQEHAPQVRLGAWRTANRAGASRGTVRISDRPAARASLSFRGRSVTLLTAKGPAFGKARVVVDGVSRIVNLYAAEPHARVPVSFTGLGAGRHTITVSPLGRKDARSSGRGIVVDAFDVRP